jgi:hypothetical protein
MQTRGEEGREKRRFTTEAQRAHSRKTEKMGAEMNGGFTRD